MVETDNQVVSSLKTEVLHEEWNGIQLSLSEILIVLLLFHSLYRLEDFVTSVEEKKQSWAQIRWMMWDFAWFSWRGGGIDINIGASLLCEQWYWHFPFPGKFNFLLAYSLRLTSIFQYGPDELLLFLELLLDEKKIPLTGLSSLKKKYCFDKCNAEVCWEGSIIDRNSFISIKSLKGWPAVRYL